MICTRCHKDKEPCLFTPTQVRLSEQGKSAYCRLCQADSRGKTYGSSANMRKACVTLGIAGRRYESERNHLDNARRNIRNAEIEEAKRRRAERLGKG